jgi:hypothetical protein
MNLWHQRLIIFFAEVLAVILGLIFIGYLLYYNIYFKTDSLIKYVPKEAVLYSTFRLTPELQQNPLVAKILSQLTATYNLPIISPNFLNQLVGNNLSIALVPQLGNNSQLDALLLVDLGLRPQNINQYLQFVKEHNWQSYVISNQTKSKNILAITSSVELLEQVKQTESKQKPALSQNIDAVFNLKKFSPENFFGKVFVAKEFFKSIPFSIKQPQYGLLLSILDDKYGQQVFAGLTAQGNNIYIQNNPNKTIEKNSASLAEIWPNSIAYSLTFTDLPATWQSVLDNLKQTDLQYYSALIKNKEYLESLYNFNWTHDLLSLIGNQTQIFVTNDKKYLLATALNGDEISDQTGQIEKLIKTFIANNYPVAKLRQLPDKTFITSIVRDTASLEFKEDEVLGLKIKSIYKGNQEFIYILAGNHLILANSRDIIINLLNTDQKIINWENTGIINNVANFSEEAWINLSNMNIDNRIRQTIRYIDVLENISINEFRLILE